MSVIHPKSTLLKNGADFAGLKRAGVPRVRVAMPARMAILFTDRTVVDRGIIDPTITNLTIDRLGSRTTDPTATAFRTIGGGVGTEEMPGFLELGVFGFGAVRGEENFGLPVRGVEGNDVPDAHGNDVSGDEVEHAFAVGDSVGVDVTFVGAGAVVAAGGFDLHAKDVGPGLALVVENEGDVVR